MFTITLFQIHIRSDPHKMSLHRVYSVSVDWAGVGRREKDKCVCRCVFKAIECFNPGARGGQLVHLYL